MGPNCSETEITQKCPVTAMYFSPGSFWLMVISSPVHFGPLSVQSLVTSGPGFSLLDRFVVCHTGTFLFRVISTPGQFSFVSFRYHVISDPGHFHSCSFRSLVISFLGHFLPGPFDTWTFRS